MPAAPHHARWYRITLSRLLIVLLVVDGLLWTSAQFGWFTSNRNKGTNALLAISTVVLSIVPIVVFLIWATLVRRRLQFDLRSLLLAVIAFAVPLAWLAIDISAARVQRDAVENIRNAGGVVGYDYQLAPGAEVFFIAPLPHAPEWLRRLLGNDLFEDVTWVDFTRQGFGPTNGPRVGDAELRSLERLTQLHDLRLDSTAVDDSGMHHLHGLTQLEVLTLGNTAIGDAGLEHLKSLTHLRALSLSDTKITDAGLQYVAGMTHLRNLDLASTFVDDAGPRNLKDLRQLLSVNLGGTGISDAGLQYMADELPQLHMANVGATRVTGTGVAKFRRALPECEVRGH